MIDEAAMYQHCSRPSNFPELQAAYMEVNQKRETYARQFDAMQQNEEDMQHPKYVEDKTDRAILYWQWAFEKI